jgi:hypothetical protein
MANVRGQVLRLLAAVRHIDGRPVAAYPDFSLFREDDPPAWWTRGLDRPEWGEILGVYENASGRGARAILVTAEGLVLLDEDGAPEQWLRYIDIDRWDRLSKEPISMSLVIWTKSGVHVKLPFEARAGDAFSFVQFLSSAIREHQRTTTRD